MKKWIKILLIASLAFNLAFIVSTVAKKFQLDDTGPSKSPVQSPEFTLHKGQKREVHSIMKQFRIKLVQFKQDILEKRMDIIEELSDPECDFDRAKTRTQELNEYENQINNLFVDTLIRINDLLDSRQRLSLLLKLSRNWFFIHEPEPMSNHHGFRERRKR